jgi:hypothetical protein
VLVHNDCGIEALRKIRAGLTDLEWDEFKFLIQGPKDGKVYINPLVPTTERLGFYKELAKMDDAGLKAFFNDFKAGDHAFRLAMVKQVDLIDVWKFANRNNFVVNISALRNNLLSLGYDDFKNIDFICWYRLKPV